MNKEVPRSNDLIDAFKERATQRKGRLSVEGLAVGNKRKESFIKKNKNTSILSNNEC